MSAESTPRINKLPFIIADLFLLGAGWAIVQYGHRPFGALEIFGVLLCVALGGWFSLLPFLKQFESDQQFGEADRLASTVGKIQELESIAVRIGVATAEWQTLQEQSGRTAAITRDVGEKIAAEARAFADFMQKANDAEKNHLRLEVDKLRRGENDWLQVVVRSLDHVFALYIGAVRSGQPQLIQQVGNFQAATRDLARRIGLNVLPAEPAEPFDATKHQLTNPDDQAPDGAVIGDVLAVGYSFQGQLLRRAVVTLQETASAEPSFETGETTRATEIPSSTEAPVEAEEREIRIIEAESGREISDSEQAAEMSAAVEEEMEDQTPLSAKDLAPDRSTRKPAGPKQRPLL